MIEFIAALVAVSILVVFGVFWSLASKPLDMTKITPYAQEAVARFVPEGMIAFSDFYLAWDQKSSELQLIAETPVFKDGANGVEATAPKIEMTVRVFDALRGRFIPKKLKADDLHVTIRQKETTQTTSPATQRVAMAETASAILDELTNKVLLHDLSARNVIVDILDPSGAQKARILFPEIAVRHDKRAFEADAALILQSKQTEARFGLKAAFDYDSKIYKTTLHADKLNPQFAMDLAPDLLKGVKIDLPVSGDLTAGFDKKLTLVTLQTKMEAGPGEVIDADLWDAPRPIKHIVVDALYDRPNKKIDLAQIGIDFGGTKIALEGDALPLATPPASGPKDMGFGIKLAITDMPMDSTTTLWPKPAVPNVRVWIVENMSKGKFSKATLSLKGRFDWADPLNPALDAGEGVVAASGAKVRYLEGMPPLEGTSAEGKFDLTQMDLSILGGGIGAVRLQPTHIHFTGFDQETQYIDIPAKIVGPVPDVLKLMDAPPLGYAKAVGLKADEAFGKVEGTVFLRFPLLNALLMNDVDVRAEANLSDLALPKLVPGIEISQGTLALAVDKTNYTLKGPASLNKIPLQISWQGNFSANKAATFESQAVVTGQVERAQIEQLSPEMAQKIKGSLLVNVRYTQPFKGASVLTGDFNLKNAALDIPEVKWQKAQGVPASFQFQADIAKGKPVVLRTIDLNGGNVRVKGTGKLDPATFGLQTLDLKPAIIGRTNATIHFEQAQGENGFVKIVADGEALDISGVQSEKDPAKKDLRVKEYDLRLGKLFSSDTGVVSSLYGRARRDKDGWNEIDLHGVTEEQHPFDIKLQPAPAGGRNLAIETQDFGGLMKGFDITDTIKGGKLRVYGKSTAEKPAEIQGTVKVGSFVVTGLPVLVRLVSAASPFGFADLITGDTSFNRLEGGFKWNDDELDFQKVRLAGTSYGLNVNGPINLTSGDANLSGTLVPFSFVNGLLGNIPLLGDVFTGGEGQGVIAASYSVKGTLSDPKIGVNPVSLLTPGFLRNLFFGSEEEPAKETK